MKIIKEVKSDFAQHKVNNFVGESSYDNATKGKKNEHSWILDIGATNHVTFSKNNFISLTVLFMKTKSETREALYRFITLIINQFNVIIKTIRVIMKGNSYALISIIV